MLLIFSYLVKLVVVRSSSFYQCYHTLCIPRKRYSLCRNKTPPLCSPENTSNYISRTLLHTPTPATSPPLRLHPIPTPLTQPPERFRRRRLIQRRQCLDALLAHGVCGDLCGFAVAGGEGLRSARWGGRWSGLFGAAGVANEVGGGVDEGADVADPGVGGRSRRGVGRRG